MAGHDDLLRLLDAHGQQFLNSFTSGARNAHSAPSTSSNVQSLDDEEEEWLGISAGDDEVDDSSTDDDDSMDDNDDGFTIDSHAKQPAVIIFSDKISSGATKHPAPQSFMSSKVSKLRQVSGAPSRKRSSPKEEADELNNIQNDALLHRLVHTKLLSGSLNPELELTPAQRRKALAGRVLELAGEKKLGKGEASVRMAERHRASKHVRDGLVRKQHAREAAQLEEAKQLGNYHPALKKLFKGSSEQSNSRPRKRDKGLRMGVGKFSGGVLKLSRDDIKTMQPSSSGKSGRGRPTKR
ncbi:hypothetical protein ONZ45_g66 [Pleurotus djamor]|nr:hypothetical protein ONZ45_g66 [Pleurotus djamor]